MFRNTLRSIGVVGILLAAAAVAPPAGAADEGLVLRMRAEQLAAEDRCDEAIEKAQRARTLDPADAKAAVIEGRCLLLLRRYDEAVSALTRARELDSSTSGVAADLASAHYHRGDKAAARRELAKAESEDADDPRAALYRGLLLLDDNNDTAAAESFERASRLDAGIDPLASYYAGLAWERARDGDKARAALERVRTRSPGDPWAREAEIALDRLDRGGAQTTSGPWARVTAGLEWDDNVVLRGDGSVLPSRISDDSDWRGFWSAEVGLEAFRTENWAGGVIAGYHGNAHFREHQFDLQYPTASLYLDRRVDESTFVRIQPFAGYAWTETDPYLFNGGATGSLHRDFGSAGAGRLWGQYTARNYLFSTPGVTEALRRTRDRDGDLYQGGYDHSIGLGETTTLRAGAGYGYSDTEGGEFSHDAYSGYVGVTQGLPLELTLDAQANYAYHDYDRDSTFLAAAETSAHRRDNVWGARAQLSRPVTDWMSIAAHWRWTDNDSNTRVFDYDRHVVGGSFTLTYGR